MSLEDDNWNDAFIPERSEAMDSDQMVAFPEDTISYEELRTTKISFAPKTRIISPYEMTCFAIPASDLGEMCKLLGIRRDDIRFTQTDIQGLVFAETPEMPNRKKAHKAPPKRSNAITLRQKYMELCGEEGKAKLIGQLEKEVERLQREIDQHQKSLVYTIRLTIRQKDELDKLKNDSDKFSSRFGDEFDQLMKHPDVKTLDIDGVKLAIYTKNIQIEHKGRVYDIGEFEIDVYTDGSNGCINFRNLTRLVDDRYPHPHVNYDGRPCLGNIQDTVPQLIAERKLAALTSVLIEYLKSYEISESGDYRPYKSIDLWPEAKKGGKGG